MSFPFEQPPPPFTIPSVQHLLPEYCHLLLPGYPGIFLSQICGLPTVDHTLYINSNKRKKKTDEATVKEKKKEKKKRREASEDLQHCFTIHLHWKHTEESELGT